MSKKTIEINRVLPKRTVVLRSKRQVKKYPVLAEFILIQTFVEHIMNFFGNKYNGARKCHEVPLLKLSYKLYGH